MYQRMQIDQHNAAITSLTDSGARLTLTDSSGHTGHAGTVITDSDSPAPTLLATLMRNPTVSVPPVDLSGTDISAVAVRKMIPFLRDLIPKEGENEVGKSYIAVIVSGNPHIDADLTNEMREALPNCQLVQ